MFNLLGLARKAFLLLLTGYCVFSLGACSISERTVYEDHEGEIPNEVFDELRVNKTSKDWLVKYLGEPYDFEKLDKEVLLVTYKFQKAHYKTAHGFWIFNYGGVERKTNYLHLIFKEDKLKKFWQDEFGLVSEHKLSPYTKERKSLVEKIFGD